MRNFICWMYFSYRIVFILIKKERKIYLVIMWPQNNVAAMYKCIAMHWYLIKERLMYHLTHVVIKFLKTFLDPLVQLFLEILLTKPNVTHPSLAFKLEKILHKITKKQKKWKQTFTKFYYKRILLHISD